MSDHLARGGVVNNPTPWRPGDLPCLLPGERVLTFDAVRDLLEEEL